MLSSNLILALLSSASLAVAQTVSSTSSSIASSTSSASASTTSACAAQPVLTQCLSDTESIANDCAADDYLCKCSKWEDVLVCYNQCPNDPGSSVISGSVSIWCSEATLYGVTTTMTAASTTTSGKASGATTTGSGTSETGSSTGTATSSASSSSTSDSAADRQGVNLLIGAGTMLAGVAGIVGLFW